MTENQKKYYDTNRPNIALCNVFVIFYVELTYNALGGHKVKTAVFVCAKLLFV